MVMIQLPTLWILQLPNLWFLWLMITIATHRLYPLHGYLTSFLYIIDQQKSYCSNRVMPIYCFKIYYFPRFGSLRNILRWFRSAKLHTPNSQQLQILSLFYQEIAFNFPAQLASCVQLVPEYVWTHDYTVRVSHADCGNSVVSQLINYQANYFTADHVR